MRHGLLAIAAVIAVASPAWAQDDEIVVTAQRRLSAFEALATPHVYMKRRADFVIVSLEVRSDTRDFNPRRDEMRQGLRNLEARANGSAISLAIVDDDAGIVRPFSMAAAEELVRADRRPDTSVVTIRLRTQVSANDTLDAINARIERFVEATPKPGRVEMETGAVGLTLVNPEQYREPLLRDIAADGRHIADMLGAGYGVEMTGLERQVAWHRSGDLELTLFLSYGLSASRQ